VHDSSPSNDSSPPTMSIPFPSTRYIYFEMVSVTTRFLWSLLVLPTAWSYVTSSTGTPRHHSPLFMETVGDDRRNFLQKVTISTLATSGIVANGVAVQGPDPYLPTNLQDKVILITGANTGLGLESAKRLAAAGATVILTSRSEVKGQEAVQDVLQYVQEQGHTASKVYSLPLDLCNFESIRQFPNLLQKTLPPGTHIDVLINNAGVMAIPTREVTVDQYERTFQTNHLGPFALTSLLIPWMNTQSPVRIVNVSSAAYLVSALSQKGLDLDNLNSDLSYDPWEAYGKSKLENILFTKELQRRFDEKQLPWEAVALHPGAVRTDLARYILGEKDFVPMKEMNNQWNVRSALQRLPLLPLFYFTKSVQRGASCQIWLAAGQGQNVKGKFYQNCKEVTLAPAAMDMDKAKKLWELSEQWSGFHFNI
jgi:NAD(P)-dependent dehydrogenase (short-subunit alcohol dehydrogenase family)